jgi:hypothetical protein
MTGSRISLQDPPLGFLVRARLERLGPVRWVRRIRRPRQADVYLLSYPKTGRTWLRVLMARLLAEHLGRPELAELGPDASAPRVPGVPRIVAKHDGNPDKKTADEIDADRSEYSGCRVILLVRDLRDTAVSNYFQATRREHCYEGDIAGYLRWPRGSFDSMLRYYNVWAAQRQVPRGLLLVRYEDLRADTAGELRRVAAFLGLQGVTEQSIEAAIEFGRFEAMQRREAVSPADGTPLAAGRADDAESFKVRRGKVGGYVDYLARSDIEWLDARIAAELDPYYGYGPNAATVPSVRRQASS